MAIADKRPRLVRLFAVLERICQPVSLLTLVGVIVLAILRRTGAWTPPPAVDLWVTPVLLSAAVGYLTNWVAITMLFEPYERTWRHWLPWATFGLWRQGLLPKNKARIAVVLADQMSTRLLRPDKLAEDLCAMTASALQDPAVLRGIQTLLQEQVAAHDTEIIEALVPRIEAALVGEIDRLVTAERIRAFWNADILPRLESVETREEIAKTVLSALRKRSPEIAAKAKPWISKTIRRFVEEKFRGTMLEGIPFIGKTVNDAIAQALASSADAIADFFLDEETLENALLDWIRNPKTAEMVRDELTGFVESFRAWLSSPEGTAHIGGFAADIRAKFKGYLRAYLQTNLVSTAERLLQSENVWSWVERALPTVRPGMERMIRDIGTPAIIRKLDIEGRIKTAVDKMDIAEFHAMLSALMAEHLGAIQVLGYLLGALAGALLFLSRA